MRRIKLTIAYDGTSYSGWQIQDNAVTVEGCVREALISLLKDCGDSSYADNDNLLIGASRTDAGVHSEGNVAVFDTRVMMDAHKFSYALNQRLPEDIRVVLSEETSMSFHPRYTDSIKTYEYRIINAPIPLPTKTRYAHHVHHKLNVDDMNRSAKLFIGEHDFSAFCSAGAQVRSKVRTIYSLDIEDIPYYTLPVDSRHSCDDIYGREIRIIVSGNGFLYNMVRIIAGTLIEIGEGRRDIDSISEALLSGDRNRAGATAPAKGLTLKGISYSEIS